MHTARRTRRAPTANAPKLEYLLMKGSTCWIIQIVLVYSALLSSRSPPVVITRLCAATARPSCCNAEKPNQPVQLLVLCLKLLRHHSLATGTQHGGELLTCHTCVNRRTSFINDISSAERIAALRVQGLPQQTCAEETSAADTVQDSYTGEKVRERGSRFICSTIASPLGFARDVSCATGPHTYMTP